MSYHCGSSNCPICNLRNNIEFAKNLSELNSEKIKEIGENIFPASKGIVKLIETLFQSPEPKKRISVNISKLRKKTGIESIRKIENEDILLEQRLLKLIENKPIEEKSQARKKMNA